MTEERKRGQDEQFIKTFENIDLGVDLRFVINPTSDLQRTSFRPSIMGERSLITIDLGSMDLENTLEMMVKSVELMEGKPELFNIMKLDEFDRFTHEFAIDQTQPVVIARDEENVFFYFPEMMRGRAYNAARELGDDLNTEVLVRNLRYARDKSVEYGLGIKGSGVELEEAIQGVVLKYGREMMEIISLLQFEHGVNLDRIENSLIGSSLTHEANHWEQEKEGRIIPHLKEADPVVLLERIGETKLKAGTDLEFAERYLKFVNAFLEPKTMIEIDAMTRHLRVVDPNRILAMHELEVLNTFSDVALMFRREKTKGKGKRERSGFAQFIELVNKKGREYPYLIKHGVSEHAIAKMAILTRRPALAAEIIGTKDVRGMTIELAGQVVDGLHLSMDTGRFVQVMKGLGFFDEFDREYQRVDMNIKKEADEFWEWFNGQCVGAK